MRLVFLGLSLSSSWGNGHATTYRALLKALHHRGHDLLFLERDQPWYAAHRDLPDPEFCALRFYDSIGDLHRFRRAIERADATIVGSYVPEGAAVIDRMVTQARSVAFYDIDTPVTLRALEAGGSAYLRPDQVGLLDLYLSFTGGPTLGHLERQWGARLARPLYCAVDPAVHHAVPVERRWDLGYLGTYSADRQPGLERLLIAAARLLPERRFVVAGPQYSDDIDWPSNVDRIEHLGPAEHAEFYSSLGWTLNVTRADMVRAGWSPSVRLFEASACGVPIISDEWSGLDAFFRPGREIVMARETEDVLRALDWPETRRTSIGRAALAHTVKAHTAETRARELETFIAEAVRAAAELAAD